ncbi:serine/threonine-protein kinase [Argonema galeatum]|uniref:serine/threonine-protein kinase n=1 Tax=Argonema galeatum TaxID=2942762 RepID=UPI002011D3C4|nr:serine/threonine-protein kinase [Argonema galeatum]MCL1466238.1 serine/threonine protein kinase [Argonema galeatum A003/A1]
MMSLYCTKRHENQTTSRFCFQCGEPLWLPVGQILETRYRILSHLGAGGFGRTYLAEDLNRFNERCVLKEFAPQVKGSRELQKAKELFEREASAIYKLNHSQLPKFREFFETDVGGVGGLFLVQDYVDGQTLYDLLKSRGSLPEAEVKQILCEVLPILSYIHSQGVIHRDISPDNLILRLSDNLPVLIDFGGVKEVAVTAIAKFTQVGKLPTLLGKEGYAPEEQLQQGQVFPNSDLYSLAVTALVLLTGKKPQELYDGYKGIWHWGKEIKVSASLEAVLKKMLAYKASDRYQSADEVLQVLQSVTPPKPANPNISHIRTMVVAPGNRTPAAPPVSTPSSHTIIVPPAKGFLKRWVTRIAGIGLTVVTGVGAWAGFNWLMQATRSIALTERKVLPLPILNQNNRADKLLNRRKALGIREEVFNTQVNKRFYAKHPELGGRQLTNSPEDAALREEWYQIAEDFLEKGI